MNSLKRILSAINFVTILIITLALQSCASIDEGKQVLSEHDKSKAVANLSTLLRDKYVFPEVADKTASFVEKRFEMGAYSFARNAEEFTQLLTSDLLTISNDRHLVVRPLARKKTPAHMAESDQETEQIIQRREEKQNNYGLKKVEILEGNVGYLKIDSFSGHDSAKQSLFAMMAFLKNVDALILDLQDNIGGNADMVRYLSSYFLKGDTLLRKTYTRNSTDAQTLWTLDDGIVPGMYNVPLYILTSNDTFSAAETFAVIMKEYGRGTIIGEETATGLPAPGREFRLEPSFKVFISTKHIVGPVSGTNEYGNSVKPDVEVPSNKTFGQAYKQAKIAAKEFGDNKTMEMISDIKASVKTLIEVEANQDNRQLEETVAAVLDELCLKWALDETAINDMGYRYLQLHANPAIARLVFIYNRNSHPKSSNVYSSLADAYSELGNIALAIKNYNLALKIDPDDGYAQEMLSRLASN